ncbi:PAS domain-containing protein [Roseomonas aerophila]|uniref:histidine kinase n=1 Tax=Teichococcus aerophilus TaxID=1224513 RepID=A0ABR7RHK3_9PROT|nr:hybrid sensor histidine kinase/response regulator [Pseudoroseomonas aerophila]MBC9205600.1 PAS domain-containing protein [Pseudoroseomonas aerophila]
MTLTEAVMAIPVPASFPWGESAMARTIRDFDWAATPLGPIADWSGTLKSTLSSVLESPLPLALLWGKDGRLLYNDAYAAFCGDRHPAILGQRITDAWPEAAAFNAGVVADVLSGRTLSFKDQRFMLHRHAEPDEVWLDLHYSVVRDRMAKPVGVLGVIMETTGRVLLERRQLDDSVALKQSETQLQALTAALPQIIWTADAEGHYDFFNERWRELTGLSPTATDTALWLSVVHPEDREAAALQWRRAVAGGYLYQSEYRLRRADGAWRWYLRRALPVRDPATSQVVRWLGTCTDIEDTVRARMLLRQNALDLEARVQERTRQLEEAQQERLLAQEQLRQAQKMEAIGNLTGGIAHDFNNLLQVVYGSLELLQRDVGELPRASQRIQHALTAVERGSQLAQQLLAFGRRQPLQPKVVNVGRFILGLDDMLTRTLGERVEVRTVIAEGLGNTLVDPGQVENALLNLAINARDAMEGEGELVIEARNIVLDATDVRIHADIVPGPYVMLSVKDTGEGIPPDILSNVFEPFFTTKPEGRGSGLGLSMVYGFVRQSGGYVGIDSTPGAGTTVSLYLPQIMAEEEAPEPQRGDLVSGGQETILVVEDDEAVRSIVVETIAALGYKVLRAKDAQSALMVLESGLQIDLLFTDVVMPGPLRSTALAERAKQLQPSISVLFTSGYAENAIVHEGRLDPGVELLSKPYTREALARKLRQVLDSGREPGVPEP